MGGLTADATGGSLNIPRSVNYHFPANLKIPSTQPRSGVPNPSSCSCFLKTAPYNSSNNRIHLQPSPTSFPHRPPNQTACGEPCGARTLPQVLRTHGLEPLLGPLSEALLGASLNSWAWKEPHPHHRWEQTQRALTPPHRWSQGPTDQRWLESLPRLHLQPGLCPGWLPIAGCCHGNSRAVKL